MKKKNNQKFAPQPQLLLDVVVDVQKKCKQTNKQTKNYLCDRLKTPKMASGHYWKVQKFATELETKKT